MSSGKQEIVINTQERAMSTDVNRLQKFANKDLAELFRYMLLGMSGGELDPSVSTFPDGLSSYMPAEIINGLMVRPSSGTMSMSIDPGMIWVTSPDGAPDDSNAKYVRDAGLATGTLTIGANASGQIRIDVVECRVNPVPLTVSDNRDIFNPSSGLFTATSVTKEVQGRLDYRIRAGTAGSGFPGASVGWRPLAVISVPSGAASVNACTFWDVRPMFEDRDFAGRVGPEAPSVESLDARLIRTSSTVVTLSGTFGARLNGRALGGVIRSAVPGTSADSMNIADAINQGGGPFAEPLGQTSYFLYACTPFGLPRWAKYDTTALVPKGPKGLLVVSAVDPDFYGRPSASVPLPTSTGLVGSATTAEGVCVSLFQANSDALWKGFHAAGKSVQISVLNDGVNAGGYKITSGSLTSGRYDFQFSPQGWPANVRYVDVLFAYGFSSFPNGCTTTSTISADVYSGSTTSDAKSTAYGAGLSMANPSGSAFVNPSQYAVLRLVRPSRFPAAADVTNLVRFLTTLVSQGGTPTLFSTITATVVGWGF
jgi:hypothetical protein